MPETVLRKLEAWTRPVRASFWQQLDRCVYRGRRQSGVLYACYDLEVSPATFDIIKFAVLAEAARQASGNESIHFVIVPGTNDGFRPYAEDPLGGDEKRWRLRNVLLPMSQLMPNCRATTLCGSRAEATALLASLSRDVYPPGYAVRHPRSAYEERLVCDLVKSGVEVPCLEATPEARKHVGKWMSERDSGRGIVSLSMRECEYDTARNSSRESWHELAAWLRADGWCPVFVPDMNTAFKTEGPADLVNDMFRDIVWNLDLRMAFYELCYLNMFVSMGPTTLCMCGRGVRYLCFNFVAASCGSATEEYLRSQGLTPGKDLPWASDFQRLIWAPDETEIMVREFKRMVAEIDVGASRGSDGRKQGYRAAVVPQGRDCEST